MPVPCGVGFSLRIRLATRLGVARAISPDARFRHPAFRSLGGNLAFAILASLGFLRRLHGTGNPSREPMWIFSLSRGAGLARKIFLAASWGGLPKVLRRRRLRRLERY